MTQTFEGGCHCGRVRFRVTADLDNVTNLQLLDLHEEGHHASDRPAGAVRADQRQGRSHDLRIQHRTAKHTFCKICGIHPFYVPRSDPDKIDVNARCLDGIDLAAIRPKYFDGKHWEAAIEKDVPWR